MEQKSWELDKEIDRIQDECTFYHAGHYYLIEEVDVPMNVRAPERGKRIMPVYSPTDLNHYYATQRLFYRKRRHFKGIDENRYIPIYEIEQEISDGDLEEKFRWCYYHYFKDKVIPEIEAASISLSKAV